MSSFHEGDKQSRRTKRPSGRRVSASGEGSLTRPRGDDGCTRAGMISEEEGECFPPLVATVGLSPRDEEGENECFRGSGCKSKFLDPVEDVIHQLSSRSLRNPGLDRYIS
jgi:hypothetical protein